MKLFWDLDGCWACLRIWSCWQRAWERSHPDQRDQSSTPSVITDQLTTTSSSRWQVWSTDSVLVGSFWTVVGDTSRWGSEALRVLWATNQIAPLPFRMCVQSKGRVQLPNRMNYWKKSERPSTPPPNSFGKLYCNFLWQIWLHICKEIWWLDSMKCMHMISRYRCNTIVIQYNCWKKTYPEPWNYYFVSISWSTSSV